MGQTINGRIGGEFEIDPKYLAGKPQPGGHTPTFGCPNEVWLDTGRSALKLALEHISSAGTSGKAWVPAYVCPSVTHAFKSKGFSVRYYAVEPDLGLRSLPASFATSDKRDVFLFIHYFGRPNKDAVRLLSTLSKKPWIIEDAAQAPFLKSAWVSSDFIFNSLRKAFPQPDGALLGSPHPFAHKLAEPLDPFISKRVLGKTLRHSSEDEEKYLRLFEESERELEKENPPRMISPVSKRLMTQENFSTAAETRKFNYRVLAHALTGMTRVSTLWSDVPDDFVPLGLPVVVARDGRDALRSYLRERRIYCPVHWHLDSEVIEETNSAHELSRRILTLPIDQRYGGSDMARVADEIRKFSP
jgi:hypothetical protein